MRIPNFIAVWIDEGCAIQRELFAAGRNGDKQSEKEEKNFHSFDSGTAFSAA